MPLAPASHFKEQLGGAAAPGQADRRICLHHVGGRNGSGAFPVLTAFEPDLINVIYDADPDCIDQIKQAHRRSKSEIHVLPYCLGDSSKTTQFNITYDPYGSSLLEFNPDYETFYETHAGSDYIFSEGLKTMEKRAVHLVALDQVLAENRVPRPDFFSIDTQGSEYEILQGARGALKSSILAVALEIGFHPFYKDQKLFGDLCALLSDHGFHFVKFLHIGEASPYRAKVGLRADGFQVYGDALFLRRIESIESNGRDPQEISLMLRKLAFISIAFNQFEYGWQCLARDRRPANRPGQEPDDPKPLYDQFLDQIQNEAGLLPEIPRLTFGSRFTFEQSKARFDGERSGEGPALKRFFKKFFSRLFGLFRQWRYGAGYAINRARDIFRHRIAQDSAVEALLRRWGLKDQAAALRRRRLKIFNRAWR
ncbi:MAG: FkbM family methyltransferase [Elusimicrobia bacterium]|nr:FkbM family methyltransferase [Elusimicrobiota bacterium]